MVYHAFSSGRAIELFRTFIFVALLCVAPLTPGGATSQQSDPPQVQTEDSLFSVLLKVAPDQKAAAGALLARNQPLVTVRLWQRLIDHAALAYHQSSPERSLAVYAIAGTVAEQLNDKRLLATTHYKLGLTQSGLGRNEAAIQSYLISRRLFEEAGLHRDLIYICGDLGALYLAVQDYAKAKEYALQAIALGSAAKHGGVTTGALPDQYGVAEALATLGYVSQRSGDYTQAAEYFRQSVALYQEIDGGSLKYGLYVADTLSSLGGVYNLLGENARALLFLHQALDTARKLPYQNLTASILNNLGVLYLDQEDYDRATDYFGQCLHIYQSLRNRVETARVLLNLAVAHQRKGDLNPALENFGKSLAEATATAHKELMIAAGEGIGAVQQAKGNHAAAIEQLNQSLGLAREISDQVRIAELLWRKAEVGIATRNYVEALALAREASALARRLQLPKLSYLTITTLGQAYAGSKQTELAIQTLSQAVEQVEAMRNQVAGREQGRQLFFENKVAAYHSLIELFVAQNKPVDALLHAERAKSRALLDVLSDGVRVLKAMTLNEQEEAKRLNRVITELNGEIRAERLKTSPDSARLDQIRAKLDAARLRYASFQDLLYASHNGSDTKRGQLASLTPSGLSSLIRDDKTAFLEYVVARDQTYLFVLTKGQGGVPDLKAYVLNAGAGKIAELAGRFRQMMADRLPVSAQLCRELYELLIKPAALQLHGKETICIVPDGMLWELPFQAMQPSQERYLIEDYAVYYAPSLSVLAEIERKEKATKHAPPSLLAFGNPIIGGETVAQLQEVKRGESFAPLPEAETEVRNLARIFGPRRSKVFTGARADESSFRTLAPSYKVIHFATHGVLDNRHPLYSYLLLAKTGEDDDGLLEAREIVNLNLQADLVVLSACETARGRIGAGEGVVGMSWAFFAAGCRTMVATQWEINSAGAAELMIKFYQRLLPAIGQERISKANALRQAAIELMQDRRYRHPAYWAGFIMVGSND
jgi:CHAT domain-containing protein